MECKTCACCHLLWQTIIIVKVQYTSSKVIVKILSIGLQIFRLVLVETHAAMFLLIQLGVEARDKLLLFIHSLPMPSCCSVDVPGWMKPSDRKVDRDTWMQEAEFRFMTH